MRRYIAMSRHDIFIFVEGRDLDPDVYSRICGPVCRGAGKSYEIVLADRVSGGGGGKNVLTQLFEFLRSEGALVERSQQDTKLTIFYLDKDVDDVFGTLRVSDHMVYTRYYSIENHLFCEAQLPSSIATAGSVDTELIRARMPDPQAWRAQQATRWREWIALCLLARKLKLHEPASYAMQQSTINAPSDSQTDEAKLTACIAEMEHRSALPSDNFRRKLGAANRLVEAVFRRSQHDLLFKGKWYVTFALCELEVASAGAPYNKNGAADRLIGSLISSINFENPWVEHFRRPLRAVLQAGGTA